MEKQERKRIAWKIAKAVKSENPEIEFFSPKAFRWDTFPKMEEIYKSWKILYDNRPSDDAFYMELQREVERLESEINEAFKVFREKPRPDSKWSTVNQPMRDYHWVLYNNRITARFLAELFQPKPEAPPPVLAFERLFATTAHMETTLAALRDLGIIDAGNRWNYGGKKYAICVVLAVLKRRKWFDKSPPDFDLAQCFAAFFGITIGEETVRDHFREGPGKFAKKLYPSIDAALPKE